MAELIKQSDKGQGSERYLWQISSSVVSSRPYNPLKEKKVFVSLMYSFLHIMYLMIRTMKSWHDILPGGMYHMKILPSNVFQSLYDRVYYAVNFSFNKRCAVPMACDLLHCTDSSISLLASQSLYISFTKIPLIPL